MDGVNVTAELIAKDGQPVLPLADPEAVFRGMDVDPVGFIHRYEFRRFIEDAETGHPFRPPFWAKEKPRQ
jgi:hypothetical protein